MARLLAVIICRHTLCHALQPSVWQTTLRLPEGYSTDALYQPVHTIALPSRS